MTSSPVAWTVCGLWPQTVVRTLKQVTEKMIGACTALRALEPVLGACGLDAVGERAGSVLVAPDPLGGLTDGVVVAPDPPGALAPPVPSPLATPGASASTAAAATAAKLPGMWRWGIIEEW